MQFSVKNVSLLKDKLEKLTKVINESAIEFRKSGIKISAMSPDNCIAAELFIPKKSITAYKFNPCNSIALNLSCLKKVLSMFNNLRGSMKFKLIENKIEISGKNGSVTKSFRIPIMNLGSKTHFPKFKPNVKWKLEGAIDGLSQISMWTNRGPLVIDTVKDNFPLSWIIAPKLIS